MKTEIITIHSEFPEAKKIAHCAKIIRDGGLVIFPTETVYGIAADFNNPKAMDRLKEVKKRAPDKPISIVVSQKGLIANYTPTTDPKTYKMIDAYWPGPLTVVVPALEEDQTIGIRMPDNAIALSLIQESQCTIAAPSANLEGAPPPKTCKEALKDLDGLVDIAIDGGTSQYGKASSVVDFTRSKPTVLREGAIKQTDVDHITGRKTVLFICTGNSCRSVMAEYFLRKILSGREDVEVVSAGTSVFLRSSASAETITILKKEGIDALGHVARSLTTILLKKSDLIFVMTRTHRQQVLERVPSVEKRIFLLKEFSSIPPASGEQLDVPDPMGRPAEAYEECMLTIKDTMSKIVSLI